MGSGGGICISADPHYKGVRSNVVSVTRGCEFPISEKNHHTCITLVWPLMRSIKVPEIWRPRVGLLLHVQL